eukprot:m.35351 g.35351  ORF g.35351 m.35351 type:complete len:464 (-) comp5271_c0_seq1:41-1432(-)
MNGVTPARTAPASTPTSTPSPFSSKPRPPPLITTTDETDGDDGPVPHSLDRSPNTPDAQSSPTLPPSSQAPWLRASDLLPTHGARIGFINNHSGDLLNEIGDTVWDFSGQGTAPPVPRGRVVRVDGSAEPAASVVHEARELASRIALARHLTTLDLTACELDLATPGPPGHRRSAFEVLVHDGIRRSGTLRVLRVSDNVLGPAAGDAVAAAMQLPSLEVLAVRGGMLGPGDLVRTPRSQPEPGDVVELRCPELAGRRGTVLPPSAFEQLHKSLVQVLLHEQAPRRTVREDPRDLVTVVTTGGQSLLHRQWPEAVEPIHPAPHQTGLQFSVEYDTVHAALSVGRLTELDLHSNYLGPVVGQKLLSALESCPCLVSLNLAFNQLDESCGVAVCEWLPRTSLHTLDLWGNVLGRDGCWAVIDGLRLNQTVAWLSLGCNGLSRADADVVQATFDRLRVGDDRATLKL